MKLLEDYRISYSYNKEDIVIDKFFYNTTRGVYVDIGAGHPSEGSLTKYFYMKGWRGINIEPNPTLYKILKNERPADINLNICVSSLPGTTKMRFYEGRGMLALEQVKRKNSRSTTLKDKYFEIKTDNLKNILNNNDVNQINFLKIDAKDYEHEILNGNDWTKFRPELICITIYSSKRNWRQLLKKARYEEVYFDGVNEYYLSEESMFRKGYFSYKEDIFLGKQIINSHTAKIMKESHNLTMQIESLRFQNFQLYTMLERYKGLKSLVRMLFLTLNDVARNRVEILKRPSLKTPKELNVACSDMRRTDLQLRKYDNKYMSEKRLIGSRSKRLMAKALEKLINVFTCSLIRSAGIVYKIARGLQ